MGADVRVAMDNNTALVKGGGALSGAPVEAPDIRAGAALVIAGLAASGETEIIGLEYIDRGYERLEEALVRAGRASAAFQRHHSGDRAGRNVRNQRVPGARARSGVCRARSLRRPGCSRLGSHYHRNRDRPRHRQRPRLRAREGHRVARALRRRQGRANRQDAGRRRGSAPDARPHAEQHSSDPPVARRRHRRLRSHRSDAELLHQEGDEAALVVVDAVPAQAVGRDLRSGRDHLGRRTRRSRRGQAGRREVGRHHRGADGGGDRRRAADRRSVGQHGRRHRRRHDRRRGDLARRHRRLAVDSRCRQQTRRSDHPPHPARLQLDDRRTHGRRGQDQDRFGAPARAGAGDGDSRPRS